MMTLVPGATARGTAGTRRRRPCRRRPRPSSAPRRGRPGSAGRSGRDRAGGRVGQVGDGLELPDAVVVGGVEGRAVGRERDAQADWRKLVESWSPEVWKSSAKIVTTPFGVIRMIRPPMLLPPVVLPLVTIGMTLPGRRRCVDADRARPLDRDVDRRCGTAVPERRDLRRPGRWPGRTRTGCRPRSARRSWSRCR